MTPDRVRLPLFWQLTWADVDPAARPPVDPAGVHDLVRSVPPAADLPPAGTDRRLTDFWFDRMTEALVERLGPWVVGWWYTVAMEDGRPVWCGKRPPVTTPAETLTRIADAVVAWHAVLVEFAGGSPGAFAAVVPPAGAGIDGPPAWRAVWGNGRAARYPTTHPHRVLHPGDLRWAEVDPAGRVFDPATVPAVVADLIAAAGLPSPEADWRLRDVWLETVTTGLVDRYGRWASGWRWSVGEGDLDGGPVGAWCCFRHSATTPEATGDAIAAALVEWHEWLGDLAQRFDRFLPLAPGDLDGWEYAVAHLVTAVGDRTRYESAWYGCVMIVLGWFLDAAGIDAAGGADGRRRALIDHAVRGRFGSWTEPPRETVESVAEAVADAVARDGA